MRLSRVDGKRRVGCKDGRMQPHVGVTLPWARATRKEERSTPSKFMSWTTEQILCPLSCLLLMGLP